MVGIIGLALAIPPYTQRAVDVVIGAPLVANRAFSSPFGLWNTGYWPLKNLHVRGWVRVAEYEYRSRVEDTVFEEHRIPWLAIGDSASIPLPRMPFDNPKSNKPWETFALERAEVSVLVDFGRLALPFRSRRAFRFEAIKDEHGAFRWVRQPTDDSDWERYDRVKSGDNRPR